MLFDTLEDELEFTVENDLDIARTDVLESNGLHAEAAELHLAEGRTQEAADLLLLESPGRAAKLVLRGLWQLLPLDAFPERNTSAHAPYFEVAEQIDVKDLSVEERTEVSTTVEWTKDNSKKYALAIRVQKPERQGH